MNVRKWLPRLAICGLVAFDFLTPTVGFINSNPPAAAQANNANCSTSTIANCVQTFSQNGVQSQVKTYKYSSLGNAPAATPSDVFTIAGSATKTIYITRIVVSGLATTAGQLNPLIIRRSAADTGGTCTNPSALPRDINNSAATATLTLCTANPTAGTTVGTLDSCRLFLQTATGGMPDVCVFSYGVNNDQLLALRGASDVVAINFAGAAVPAGGILDLDVEWTEAP